MGRWFRIAAAAAVIHIAAAAMQIMCGSAFAQTNFPSRSVHILVPYPAGGGVDVLTRTLGDVVSKQWGQSVVVENRPGAGGVIASQAVATAPPDGYTLIMVASGHATNPFLYAKIPYDTFKDFTPVSLLASSPNILLVRADSPFKTVAEMIAAAKAKPGSLSFAHAGNGTSTHLAGELLKNLAKVDLTAIPYKGGAPAINDLLGGQIPMSFNNGPESVGQLQAGTLRALAVTTASRAPFLPDVPSMSETVPGYDTGVWWGLLGPAGMPPEVLARLSQDFVAALNTDAVKERLAKLGAQPIGSTPQQFDAQNPRRLREMGADHQGRRNESRMIDVVPPMIPACLPPRDVTRPERTVAARRLRHACACVRSGGSFSLCGRSQLHAAGCAAGKISRHARYARFCARRAGAGQCAWPRQFGDARCAEASSRTACAASRWPMRVFRRTNCARGTRSASAACASITSFATGSCIIAAAFP